MDEYRTFLKRILNISYTDVYLVLNVDVLPQLTEYIKLIRETKFEDGSYHSHYGELKKYVSSFVIYWKYMIDVIIQEADKRTNAIDREQLLILMDRTIDIHQSRQVAFGKGFLPVQSPLEKQTYEEMEDLYNQQTVKLHRLKEQIEELDKQEKVDNFVKDHFNITTKRTAELFESTNDFLAMMLADRVANIRISLEEILLRISNNLRDMQAKREAIINSLLCQLYDRNKELLQISRQYRKCSTDYAETGHGIERIQEKIEQYLFDPPLPRLEEEVAHWQERVADFHRTTAGLQRLRNELEDVLKQEQVYNSMRTTELPGSKRQCWLNMGENYAKRREYLNEKIMETAKSLVTFFAVRGADRILYTDDIGQYYVDEFNHQVYVFNYGLDIYHRNCKGDFNEVSDKNKYYFDTFGRYIKGENEQKMYQCAPCTSQYDVTSDNLLKKVTADCGHSEKKNEDCRLFIKDTRNAGEILPQVEPIKTKGTLPAEAVRYLWDSFGAVLPLALRDVGTARSANPIQHLAHSLLLHKYNKTKAEFRQLTKGSADYRANIFRERKEQAVASSRAWRAKQTKRRQPEESDDADERRARDAVADQLAVVQLMNRAYDYY